MGGRWSIEARNLQDNMWQVCEYTVSFIKWVCLAVKCLMKYDVVILGKHS